MSAMGRPDEMESIEVADWREAEIRRRMEEQEASK